MITLLPEYQRKQIFELSQSTLREDGDDAREALAYLKETRGLSDDIITEFKFGYIPQRSRHDWSGRIIMPLIDQNDSLVVLTTRNFRTTAKENRPHLHEEFEKSRYLFGLNVAKRHILKHGKAIVVEGQFDTTVLHTFGINITVGLLGSALSHDHACLLRRYCSEVYLMFDADEAGKKSMDRALELAKEKCFHLFDFHFIPVILPKPKEESKMDPDLFIRKNGKEALLKILRQSKAEYEMNR